MLPITSVVKILKNANLRIHNVCICTWKNDIKHINVNEIFRDGIQIPDCSTRKSVDSLKYYRCTISHLISAILEPPFPMMQPMSSFGTVISCVCWVGWGRFWCWLASAATAEGQCYKARLDYWKINRRFLAWGWCRPVLLKTVWNNFFVTSPAGFKVVPPPNPKPFKADRLVSCKEPIFPA